MQDKIYTLEEAIKEVKANAREKFDATVEVHVDLKIDPKKNDQAVRIPVTLPNGTGKTKKVAVMASSTIKSADIQLNEDDLTKIEKGDLKPGVDFDVLVCEPQFMSKLAKVAKILGPKGYMPNPKSGTVTNDVAGAVEQIKAGKLELRNENNGTVIHTLAGKTSFTEKDLAANINEIMTVLKGTRPAKVKAEEYIKSAYVSSTMGKSYRFA